MTISCGGIMARIRATSSVRMTGARPSRPSAPLTVILHSGAVMSFHYRGGALGRIRRSAPAAVQLECLSGELWVTQEGDRTDHLLRAGEVFQSATPGVVAQALREATLCVTEVSVQREQAPARPKLRLGY